MWPFSMPEVRNEIQNENNFGIDDGTNALNGKHYFEFIGVEKSYPKPKNGKELIEIRNKFRWMLFVVRYAGGTNFSLKRKFWNVSDKFKFDPVSNEWTKILISLPSSTFVMWCIMWPSPLHCMRIVLTSYLSFVSHFIVVENLQF